MKIRFSKELFVLLAVAVLLLASAAATFLLPPGWFEAVTFDAVVKEDTLLLGDENLEYLSILREDGEEQRLCIRQDTRITDEDGRKLDLTEGVELKAGQSIRVTARSLVYYEPVTTFETCFKIVMLSP
ncbi:MAG: hypothetical protein MRZ73_10725 [Pseudoflavonifractor capillosus]|uniref:hypothetical protein n=1 Tax=Pseudoflavonifractor capillosus TaxID=106588 RepID=UPI0023F84746|nr:hypothetical protein [Pseudoflavonifractor capillosus]MCI5928991.1 hypothetical protein [Pseudoflavonifractor capillosus]MDY4660625.1 hypothetical protein [Pseudoflavonifractor capillosus]